ncbi:X-ray repair cross-complementing protein 6-like [Pseudomyrmex gracilis]|uniref:X-ray repair cross-complementing protein 6-like n=1 Tax=Pseudomyrmex gracilis TaxID=219809 RepID=UPI000995969B|nr:X-ray repair cross-complementing protein 6-like [Pseudomyrmex gracilis]
MALSDQDYDTDDEDQLQSSQPYGVREATLFLVDASEKMFDKDKDENLSYIQKFLKLYKQIVRRKLAWNMKDYLGVILFGTEKNDADSAWKNIQTLQKLKVVTVDDLLLVRNLKKNNMKDYKSLKSRNYPLHDALAFAMDIYLNTKTVFTKRRIILITCHSPELTNEEKHSIRVKAGSLKDLDVELHVISMDKNWVVDQFYKDLIMLSKTTNVDGEMSVVDLVQQIQVPNKNLGRLCFIITDGLELDVAIRTLCRKRRSLRTKLLSKATNEVLTRTTYFKANDSDNDEENSDEDDFNVPFMIPEEVRFVTRDEIGKRKLRFTREERAKMKHLHPSSIKVIGTRPLPDDLFRYHVNRKFFVTPDYGSTRKDNLLVFGAFLTQCAAKRKMIVCAITMRKNTQTNLCYMIPNVEWGGFYLSKVAFQGDVGDKSSVLHLYDTQNSVTDKEVKLWEKTIDQLDINYHPHMFKSHKLECQIQMVERLALDKEPGEPPINTMEQSFTKACEKVRPLIPEFKEMYSNTFNEPSKPKRARKK